MEFQITGHNIEVTPALRETVEKRSENWNNCLIALTVFKSF